MYSEIYVSRRKRGMNSMLGTFDKALEKDEAQCLECGDIYKYGEHHICPWERTLRDEFAMAAVTGVMADPKRAPYSAKELAKCTYEIADAMMEVR